MVNVSELPAVLAGLSTEKRREVDRVLSITKLVGFNQVTELLQGKVATWCGGDASAAEAQTIISVHNRWTFETANLNALRAKRPVAAPRAEALTLDELAAANEGVGRCDFCDPERLTCVEPFGRLRGKHCLTAGNVFKSAGLHGLVIWNRHSPHLLTDDEVADGLEVADRWIDSAITWDAKHGGAKVPVMWWNMFPSAGASQIHPHLQLVIFEKQVGHGALLEDQGAQYFAAQSRKDLSADIGLAHRHLGLAADVDGVTCWASLTPKVSGGELCALGPSTATGLPKLVELARAVSKMLRAMRRRGNDSISITAVVSPSRSGANAWLLRCSGRGRATIVVNDAGSSELLGITGVGSDPFAIFQAFCEEVDQPTDDRVAKRARHE